MSQGSLKPKIRFLGQKLCSVACDDGHTDTKVTTVGRVSGVFPSTYHQGSAQKKKVLKISILQENDIIISKAISQLFQCNAWMFIYATL